MKVTFSLDKKFSEFFSSVNFPFFSKTFRVIIQLYNTPKTYTEGITSRCFDSRHVLFMDFDNIGKEDLLRELSFLQETFRLANFYVFKLDRPNSFHAICLQKMSIQRAYNILRESSSDTAFTNSIKVFMGKEWVLRVTNKGDRKKPVFDTLIYTKQVPNWKISTAHKEFLEMYYNVPKILYFGEDGLTELPVIRYNTASRVSK